MAVAFCPECRYDVKLDGQPYQGQRVTCTSCGVSLEVINLSPLELDWVYYQPDDAWAADWVLEEAGGSEEGWEEVRGPEDKGTEWESS